MNASFLNLLITQRTVVLPPDKLIDLFSKEWC